jgi:hypothetical protein
MGSIENYKFPEHTIEEGVEIIEIISDENLTNKELLADRLGHNSEKSGAFRNKLTSLRRYNLINKRGDIRLTPLAERITMPEPGTNEKEEAIGEAVMGIDLLAELYDRLDYSEPDDNFFYQVAQVTGAERAEAKNKATQIERLYKSGLPYVRETEPESGKEERTGEESKEASSTKEELPEEADATLITPDGTTIHIKGKATYIAAKAILDEIAHSYGIDSNEEKDSTISDSS